MEKQQQHDIKHKFWEKSMHIQIFYEYTSLLEFTHNINNHNQDHNID